MPRSIASRLWRGMASTANAQALAGVARSLAAAEWAEHGGFEDGAGRAGAGGGRRRDGPRLARRGRAGEGAGRGVRRRRARVPGASRSAAGAGGARPRGRGRDVGALAGAGRGARAPLHGGRGVQSSSRPRRRASRRGAGDAALALVPLLEDSGPTSSSATSSPWRPSLAAELCGVPRATLIPHLYPVHEAGMPFFGFGMAPPRTAFGRRGVAGGAAGARGGAAPRAARAERDARADRAGAAGAVPRRDQRPARDRRHVSAARVSAAVAGEVRGDRAAGVRAAASRDRAAGGRGAAGAGGVEHGAGSRVRADQALLRGAGRRAGAGGGDDERPPARRSRSTCRRTGCSSTGSPTRR